MKQLIHDIMNWHLEEFGPTTPKLLKATILKWNEECFELLSAEAYSRQEQEELADVFIVGVALLARMNVRDYRKVVGANHIEWCEKWAECRGVNLEQIVIDKFEIVKGRNQRERAMQKGEL